MGRDFRDVYDDIHHSNLYICRKRDGHPIEAVHSFKLPNFDLRRRVIVSISDIQTPDHRFIVIRAKYPRRISNM